MSWGIGGSLYEDSYPFASGVFALLSARSESSGKDMATSAL